MIFEDFLEQIKFLEKIAAKTPNLNWFLKPHPNAIDKNYEIFYKIFANFKYIPDVKFWFLRSIHIEKCSESIGINLVLF